MIDINILLDYVCRREPFYELSRRVFILGVAQEVELYLSVNMLTDLYHLLKKYYGAKEAQIIIEDNLEYLQLVGISPDDALYALKEQWPDFEDALVAQCAHKVQADYIVTRNVKDFSASRVKAIAPQELFAVLEKQGICYDEIDW
ncbi:PIN domain-containing protein [Eggerthellaceae bacterium 3-80]